MRMTPVPRFLLLFGAAALLLKAVAPAGAEGETTTPDPPRQKVSQPTAPAERKGSVALAARCARCHDADGSGRKGRTEMDKVPDFSNARWQASRTDGQLLLAILDGKGDHMPSYRDKLSEKEANDMVVQIRTFAPAAPKNPAPPAASPNDDFERRMRELKKELEDLKKKSRDQSDPPRKP